MRRLFDGELRQPRGPLLHVRGRAVRAAARSRPHLPILVGGSGPKKTLRTVARHADGWNTSGDVETVKG